MNILRYLFNPRRPTIDSLRFTTFGWILHDKSAQRHVWVHPNGKAQLSINFFPLPPDLPPGPDLGGLRQQYRRLLAEKNGGILEASIDHQAGIPIVRTLFKFPLHPSGLVYIGSFTIPFRDCSYVLKIQASEEGFTGIREAIVAEQLLQSGELQPTDDGYSGWYADPYEPSLTTGNLMNLAERSEYDAEWPEHPLSIVRQQLSELRTSLHFQPELQRAAPFA